MTQHLQPSPSQSVQRLRFNTRVRRLQESVEAYIAQLKQLAEHYNFGDVARLNSMLLDRLICGINHEKWQQRLLAEGDKLTYEKAHELLLALEAAEKQVKDITGETPVHQVTPIEETTTVAAPWSEIQGMLPMRRIAQRRQVSFSERRVPFLQQNWPYRICLSTKGEATPIVARVDTEIDA